jgi:hypothetical protein
MKEEVARWRKLHNHKLYSYAPDMHKRHSTLVGLFHHMQRKDNSIWRH